MDTQTEIVYIHGANASPVSFNLIRQCIGEHIGTYVRYSMEDDLAGIITDVSKAIDRKIRIVGHSLGGVIGVALSQMRPDIIEQVVTMSSPFAGSDVARRLRILYPFSSFIQNVSSSNPVFRQVVSTGAVVPTLSIVTTAGHNPLSDDENDGVVSIKSQMALPRARYVDVHLNHFEVLLDPFVGKTIADFLDESHK